MVESIESNTTNSPETNNLLPEAHLVTGHHPIKRDDFEVIRNKIASGDLGVHVWSSDVSKELKSIHPSPAILSIDGLVPRHPNKPSARDYDTAQNRSIWSLIPESPSTINPTGKILIVAGDVGSSYQEVLLPLYSQHSTDEQAHEDAIKHLTKKRPSLDFNSDITIPDLYLLLPSASAAIAALTAAVNIGDREITERISPPTSAKSYARRSVLKLGAFGAGMFTAGYLLNKYLPKNSVPHLLDDDIVDTVKRIAKRETVNDCATDGRTALLVEKGIVAARNSGQTEVTIVAGNRHENKKDVFLKDQQARADAIGEYAKLLIKIVDEASAKAGFDDNSKQLARGILLDNLMYGQILRVNDTGIRQSTPHEVDQILDKSINFESDFMLSGSPVSDAIDTLRQGAPKVYGPFGMKID